MLDSTIELITLAASNSLVIFCFCNLIIAVLLVGGGSKPGSEFGHECKIPPPTIFPCRTKNEVDGLDSTACSEHRNDASTGVSNECAEQAMVECAEKAMGDEEKENDEEEDNDDGDDDELRRRVEEFIDKINEGWKAEKLRTSVLV